MSKKRPIDYSTKEMAELCGMTTKNFTDRLKSICNDENGENDRGQSNQYHQNNQGDATTGGGIAHHQDDADEQQAHQQREDAHHTAGQHKLSWGFQIGWWVDDTSRHVCPRHQEHCHEGTDACHDEQGQTTALIVGVAGRIEMGGNGFRSMEVHNYCQHQHGDDQNKCHQLKDGAFHRAPHPDVLHVITTRPE